MNERVLVIDDPAIVEPADVEPAPSARPLSMTDVETRRQRQALGGRAQDRLRRRGKKLEYVAHDKPWGAAAARRRRQMAQRGLFGCEACSEPTPAANLIVVGVADGTEHRICRECAIAAGVPIVPLPEREAPSTEVHELQAWEGEGGAPPAEL